MRGERGFTLLETLLVMGIVGVLTALAFNTYAYESQRGAIRQDMALVAATFEEMRSNSLRYNVTHSVSFAGATLTVTATGRPDRVRVLQTCTVQNAVPVLRWRAPLAEFETATDPVPGGVEVNLDCPTGVRVVKVIGVTGKTYY